MAAAKAPLEFHAKRPWAGQEAVGDPDEEDEDDSGESENGFSLEEVLRLGGTKQDYLMLATLDENEEVVDGGKKGAVDDLQQGELEAFIQNLSLAKYAKSFIEDDEQPKKENANKKETKVSNIDNKKQNATESERTSINKVKNKRPEQRSDKNSGTISKVKKDKQQDIFEFFERQTLLLKPGGKWYDLDYTNEYSLEPQPQDIVSKYKTLAQKLYEHEVNLFKSKTNNQKGASSTWMKAIVSSGTLGDRMAAMILLIQDDAIHTLQFVETLVNLVKKKGSKQQCLMALDTFKELLITDLLPESRKLQIFSQRPFNKLEQLSSGNKDSRDRRLILWYFEHQLKHLVAEFVQVLETLSHDSLVTTKTRALTAAHELLCNKPEEEKALLVQVVNKLGDPQNRIATKASHLLETLLCKHPNMKGVVCGEVERLLFRSNISSKAQYYAICFLNQMVLSHEESELANKLITLYFCFFRTCIKKKDIESKMLSALLTGVNRAYPYSETGDEKVKEQVDTLFKVLHVVNFNTSVQALMLLFQVMNSQQTISDRYYTALYRKMLDPGLMMCSKQAMFLNLVYKSLKADIVLRRVKAFVKRLLQVTCTQMPPFICGALYLVSEIFKAKPGLRSQLNDHPESDDEENFVDIGDDEDIEKFTDADKETEMDTMKKVQTEEAVPESDTDTTKPKTPSWVHFDNLKGGKQLKTYDPFSRNPLFCGAENTSLWELKKLSEHFHPSVALFAKTILQGNYIQYPGDPLQDFTLMRFLDRFVYRNPKPHKGKENTDSVVMQPKRKHFIKDTHGLAVNSKEFLAKEESQIPVDEVFFHRYYKKVAIVKEKQKRSADEESVEDVDDEEFEKMIDTFEDDNCFTPGKDDLDFASNMKKKTKKAKDNLEYEDSEDSDDEFDNLDDDEVSLGSMNDEEFAEIDEDGGTFMDVLDDENESIPESDEDGSKVSTKRSKRKDDDDFDFAGSFQGPRKKKKRNLNDSSLFVSAEEFGHLLDENVGSKFDNIGINAMANKDNASLKQLRWEAERDDWLHNRDVKSIIKKKKNFKKKRQKPTHKTKKQRK
ncbi:CCAAT/enhancer-binding protein zeta isoform X1 [Ictidomys tridecemlineatus]|uniref:CCAAT/enhancer-binding protein zeta n=1 Tax=Ictidomys tridecemlineatus TaxID=43179 RepID=I3N484_ICTTR|nr:CCAAT/enhancer-binding protein zeta [Ictidomys tridecemlineatus]KAG3267460.1 CCAAT/enhancer binding protein zeta [Ictidomys tridecemlineatus]